MDSVTSQLSSSRSLRCPPAYSAAQHRQQRTPLARSVLLQRPTQQRVHLVRASRIVDIKEHQALVEKQPAAAAVSQPKSGWSPSWPLFGRKKQQAALATISEAELWQLLAVEQQVPLVVIFSAKWCGPCKIAVQRLEALMKALGPQGIKAVKIDTDDSPELATALKVYKLPTLFFVGPSTDKPAAQVTGVLPESVLQDMVQNKSQYLGANLRQPVVW